VINLNVLQDTVLEVYKKRGWGLDWKDRGVYMHLEVSEFIESLRGKGKDSPVKEAADVLGTLLAATAANGIKWSDVWDECWRLTNELDSKPHYEGESYDAGKSRIGYD
jgi:hypothetical protein